MDKDLESVQEARHLVETAHDAWLKFEDFAEDQVERILSEISRAAIANAEALARIAVDETGYGTVEHKTLKNLFCADDVYRAIRPMKTVGIVNEDKEKKVFEVATSIGVIAAIIPSTNPTSTAIYKALIALKGRNTIVFSPHPSAVRSIGETSRIIAEAAERAGAPKNVISCMRLPTMEGTQELMKHSLTSLILATGGTGLVKAAYSAGKPAFGVGPGNVPKCIEILNFGGLGHTLSVHTNDEEVVRQFALRKPAFRICVNTPAALGAVGYTTNLFPSMTLGCGAAGGNITSDNISPLHLINLKRVAYGVRELAAPAASKTAAVHAAAAGGRRAIEELVDQWLGARTTAGNPAPVAASPPAAPPLSSYKDLEPPRPQVEKTETKPVGFVCEEDVRAAVLANSKIVIGKKTIITPSAREMAEANDVFVVSE